MVILLSQFFVGKAWHAARIGVGAADRLPSSVNDRGQSATCPIQPIQPRGFGRVSANSEAVWKDWEKPA
jgi:hypothetical protein